MIERGDSPEHNGANKFIGKRGDAFRGRLIAVGPKGDEAIVQTFTPTSGGAPVGALILVREVKPTEYPREVRQIDWIPKGFRMMLA